MKKRKGRSFISSTFCLCAWWCLRIIFPFFLWGGWGHRRQWFGRWSVMDSCERAFWLMQVWWQWHAWAALVVSQFLTSLDAVTTFFFSTGQGTVIFWSGGVDLIRCFAGLGVFKDSWRRLFSALTTQLVGSERLSSPTHRAKEERDRRSSSLRRWCGCPRRSCCSSSRSGETRTLIPRGYFDFFSFLSSVPDHASWGSWFHSAASLFLGFVLLQAVVSSSSFSEEDAVFRSGSFVVWIW